MGPTDHKLRLPMYIVGAGEKSIVVTVIEGNFKSAMYLIDDTTV